MTPSCAVCLLLLVAVLAAPVAAQAPSAADDRPVRRVEVSVGGGVITGAGLGSADADLRARGGGDFLLFTTESEVTAAPVVDLRAAFPLSRRYVVEGRFGFSRPELRTSVSGDIEGAPALTVTEQIDQYIFDGALLVMLDRFRLGPVVPFASAGAGYVRQLHEGLTLVEHGTAIHLGGGARHWLFARDTGLVKAAGFRADARLYLLSGGISGTDGATRHGAVSGGVFVSF